MYIFNLHLQVFGVNLNVIYIGSKDVLVIMYVPSAGKIDRNVFSSVVGNHFVRMFSVLGQHSTLYFMRSSLLSITFT